MSDHCEICAFDGTAQAASDSEQNTFSRKFPSDLTRAHQKERLAAEKQWHMLRLQTFNCPEDAENAVQSFNQGWKFHQVVAETAPITHFAKRGRLAADDEPEIVSYGLKGSISAVTDRVEVAERTLGKFIIATIDPDAAKLFTVQMLSNYTDQGISVERGFRFLKDPLFFADSLFLRKPERIMALMTIMGLVLLIYTLAERQLPLALGPGTK